MANGVANSNHDPCTTVVGIGASAGGLAAFEQFFSALSPAGEANMAFILVQHLDPDHESWLSNLVRQYTEMQVYEAKDGMEAKKIEAPDKH